MLRVFDEVRNGRILKVNIGKSKVMVSAKTERGEQLNVSLNGEILEEVNSFKYLRALISNKRCRGGCDRECERRN